MPSGMVGQMFLGSKKIEMFFLPHPSAKMCFDPDPVYQVFLLNTGIHEAQEFKAKLCLGGKVPADHIRYCL